MEPVIPDPLVRAGLAARRPRRGAGGARVAGDQRRSGGYATGTLGGVGTRRYHGLLVAALPGRGAHGDAEPAQRRPAARRRPGALPRRQRAVGGARALRRLRTCWSSGWRWGCPSGPTSCTATRSRSAWSCRTASNTVQVTYRLLDGPASVALELRPGVHFRASREAGGRAAGALPPLGGGRPLRDQRGGERPAAAAPACSTARRRRSGWSASGWPRWSTGWSGAAATTRRATCGARVTSAWSCRGDGRCCSWPPPSPGRWPRRWRRRWPWRPRASAAAGCWSARPRRRGRGRPPSWCWPPTPSSSRPSAASRTRCAPAPRATSRAR